jgi:hypothetical protein
MIATVAIVSVVSFIGGFLLGLVVTTLVDDDSVDI